MNNKYCIISIISLAIYLISSCTNKDENIASEKDVNFDKILVVNEIMASNHTGIMSENDSLYDWIEIKNVSKQSVNLHDYALATVEKKKQDEGDTTKVLKTNKWKMPEKAIAPGEIILVFASNRDIKDGNELHTDFKIAKKDGSVQILSKEGTIMSEAKYDKLASDQCYRRMNDGTYEKSYQQSPTNENSTEGYINFLQTVAEQRTSPVLIWEAHLRKNKYQKEWVELKNVSDKEVSLKDYALAVKPYGKKASRLGDVKLAPGEIRAIECGKEFVDIKGSKSLALVKDGEFMDGICAHTAPYGVSMGRMEGKKGFYYFLNMTKGAENRGNGYKCIADAPVFDLKPGVYGKETLTLSLTAPQPPQGERERRVHYTTDGSWPTEGSPILKDSIRIDRTTVIRAFAEGDSVSLRSRVSTFTYFVGEEHTLPVVNISVNSADLFDPTHGIYMDGPNKGTEYPYMTANYWQKVWKRAHVEFYDVDGKGSFSEDCGLSIFGGFSRTLSKKSFKLKMNDVYDSDGVEYDVFREGERRRLNSLVLRSGSQDMSDVMVRDEFFTSLMKQNSPSLLVQAYRPVALYINAEYFGLYYIREKINKDFVADHLSALPSYAVGALGATHLPSQAPQPSTPASGCGSNDSVNVIMSLVYNEEGPKEHYLSMLNYARNNDLREKRHYEYMRNLVDLNGLIDEKIGQIYSGNTDVGNIRYVRSTGEGSDKRWYFVFYDIDLSWITDKPASFYLRGNADGGVGMHNVLIDRLLMNADFRGLFLERLSMHLHKTLKPENAAKVFDELTNEIRPEMKLNCKRWPKLLTFDRWERNIKIFRKKFYGRDKYVLNSIRKELKVTPEENKKYFADLGF